MCIFLTVLLFSFWSWLWFNYKHSRSTLFTFFKTSGNHFLTFCPSYFELGNQIFIFFFSVKGLVPLMFTWLFAEGRSLWALKGCVIVRYYKNTTTELFKKKKKRGDGLTIDLTPKKRRPRNPSVWIFNCNIFIVKSKNSLIHLYVVHNWWR